MILGCSAAQADKQTHQLNAKLKQDRVELIRILIFPSFIANAGHTMMSYDRNSLFPFYQAGFPPLLNLGVGNQVPPDSDTLSHLDLLLDLSWLGVPPLQNGDHL